MDEKTIQKLQNLPWTVCFKCKSKQSYGNPMARCGECREKFCFDHISALQFKKGMKQNEELRKICDVDIKKHGYITI